MRREGELTPIKAVHVYSQDIIELYHAKWCSDCDGSPSSISAAQHVYLKRRQWKPLWNGTESLKTLYFCRMIGPITCIATMCFVCQTICELCLQLDFSNNSTDMNNKTTITKKKKYPSRKHR